MPYRLLNIGQLLFLLPNPELKQKVRILEKMNKLSINAKIGTIFNKTCLIEGLFPAYTNIYIYIQHRVDCQSTKYCHIYLENTVAVFTCLEGSNKIFIFLYNYQDFYSPCYDYLLTDLSMQ